MISVESKLNSLLLLIALIFICLVSLYFKVSKVQRDVEHLVVMMDFGICEGAE